MNDKADITAATVTILKLMNDGIDTAQIETAIRLFDRLIKKEEADRVARQTVRWKTMGRISFGQWCGHSSPLGQQA